MHSSIHGFHVNDGFFNGEGVKGHLCSPGIGTELFRSLRKQQEVLAKMIILDNLCCQNTGIV